MAQDVNAADREVYKLVCISTAHLEQHTSKAMEALAGGDTSALGCIVAPFREGFFVSCQRAVTGDHPEHPSLQAVRLWAQGLGYQYVMLDADGYEQPDLPVYEW